MSISKPILDALQGSGINLGHDLAQKFVPETQEFITDSDIRTAAAMGCKHVRIPVDMAIDWRSPETLNPQKLLRLRRLIKTCHENGLATIVTPFGELNDRLGQHVKPAELAANIASAKRFWREFARTLASEFGPEKTVLQVANEPNSWPEHWQPIQEELIKTIRETAPKHTLMTACILRWGAGESDFGAIRAITDGKMTPEDTNTVMATNFYEPYYFTHQLAKYADRANIPGDLLAKFIHSLPWYATPANTAQLAAELKQQFPNGPYAWAPDWVSDYAKRYPDAESGTANDSRYLRDELGALKDWMKNTGRAVQFAETGVFKLGGIDLNERNGYLRDLNVYCKALGIGNTCWELKAGFGILNSDGPNYIPRPDPDTMTAAGFNAKLSGPAHYEAVGALHYAVTVCGTSGDDIIHAKNPSGAHISPGGGNNLVILDTATRADVVQLQGGFTTILRNKAPNSANRDAIYIPGIANSNTLTFRKEGAHLIIEDNAKPIALLFEHLDDHQDDKKPNRGMPLLITGPLENLHAYKLAQKKVNGQYLQEVPVTKDILPPSLFPIFKTREHFFGEREACRIESPFGAAAVVGLAATGFANRIQDPKPTTRRPQWLDHVKRLMGGKGGTPNER